MPANQSVPRRHDPQDAKATDDKDHHRAEKEQIGQTIKDYRQLAQLKKRHDNADTSTKQAKLEQFAGQTIGIPDLDRLVAHGFAHIGPGLRQSRHGTDAVIFVWFCAGWFFGRFVFLAHDFYLYRFFKSYHSGNGVYKKR